VASKLKPKSTTRQSTNYLRCQTHIFQDKPAPSANFQFDKNKLTPFQQYLIETKSMERPFTGNLWDELSTGFYHCAVCDSRLFTFNHKYQSKTGYPSFWAAIEGRVKTLDE
jgi:peptide methionine sulfoxide reductase MsrB